MRYPYIIGIDGGGTKTAGVLLDQEGRLLAHGRVGASNPNDVGLEVSCALIAGMAERLIRTADVKAEECCLFAGIAGVISLKAQMLERLHTLCPDMGTMDLSSDLVNLLSAELPVGDGACVICGTGSACFLRRGAELIRIGGWGYLLDSAGSGYDIGRQALEAVLRVYDHRDSETRLTQRLAEALGAPVQDSITRLYVEGKPLIASLAPVVFQTAAQGDETAERILQRNAQAIVEYIRAARCRLDETAGADAPLPVVMGGGISQHEPAWVTRVTALIPDQLRVTVRVATAPPLWGAAVEAYRRSGYTPNFEILRARFLEAYPG